MLYHSGKLQMLRCFSRSRRRRVKPLLAANRCVSYVEGVKMSLPYLETLISAPGLVSVDRACCPRIRHDSPSRNIAATKRLRGHHSSLDNLRVAEAHHPASCDQLVSGFASRANFPPEWGLTSGARPFGKIDGSHPGGVPCPAMRHLNEFSKALVQVALGQPTRNWGVGAKKLWNVDSVYAYDCIGWWRRGIVEVCRNVCDLEHPLVLARRPHLE